MATLEFISKRIEGKLKEIDKLTKKLDRINAAKESGWEKNPYYYGEDDLRRTTRDLESAKKSLAEYQAQLDAETEKSNSRNIQVILDFLAAWKERVTTYYLDSFRQYPEAYTQYQKDLDSMRLDWHEDRRMRRKDPEEYAARENIIRGIKEEFRLRFNHITPYLGRAWNPDNTMYWTLDEAKLDKDLTDESNRKYDFIIERTNAIVGQITDASCLRIGAKGDLNGYITGTKGRANVQTIGAGGYNIQCFHFRTLINRMK